MSAPDTAPPPPAPPRAPLLGRIGIWLADHDPGGIDTTRALHLGIALVGAILLGVTTSQLFGLDMTITFPLMAGTGALTMISFNPAASRRTEAVTMVRLFAVAAAFLALLAVVGPGEGAGNAMAQKLLLIPLSFCALILRRYGMDGQRLGLALIVVATVGTILTPTRLQALLLLAAFCQGAVVSALLRLSPWRPSAVAAYVQSTLDVQAAVAAFLREMSDAVRTGAPFTDDAARAVERLRARVWNALGNALAEDPGGRVEFEALRAKFYRLRVAVQLLAGCIPQNTTGPSGWRSPFATAADHIARRLEAIDVRDVHSQERFERAIALLREQAFSPDLPPEDRFALLRALTAFDRLSLVIHGIETAELAPFPSPHSEAEEAPPPVKPIAWLQRAADGTRQLSAPLKVACQGLVATSLTTALDLGLHLSHAYWATMTVMFVIGNSVGETYVRVRYRVVGTLVGVLIGILFFLVLGDTIWLLAILCMAAQLVSIVTQKDRYDVASAAVGFSVVLGLHILDGLGTSGMLARIYETAIGALTALAISYVVLPVYVTDQFRPEVEGILKRCREALASWWPHPGTAVSVASQVAAVRQLSMRLPQFGAEQSFGHSAGDAANVVSTLDVLVTYLALIEDISGRLGDAPDRPEMVAVVEAARSRSLTAFAVVLHEGGASGLAAAAPAVEAAVSTALKLADEPAVKDLLPLVADYLAYSDALLRPLRELRTAMQDETPWQKERTLAAGDTPMRVT
ncbi:FUSC family protein [Xanthobacter variabilis]|uniref:FUSC family protein n=1 Tax=Xanthobacter variabilis TaxID=3119932 RepID=UPI00372C5E33